MTHCSRPIALFWLLFAVLPGCSLWPDAPEPAALHDLGPYNPKYKAFPWTQAIVTSPDWLNDTGIHYRLLYARPTERRSYTRDRWVAPPGALLQQHLNNGLDSIGPRLRIELQDFEQIFDLADSARVVMVVRATAEASQPDTKPASLAFRFEAQAPSPDAAGALQAFPDLIRKAEDEMADWVRQLPMPDRDSHKTIRRPD